MRKLGFLFLALAFSACGDSNDNNNNGGAEKCTLDEVGSTKCTGDVLMVCNQSGTAGVWATKENCAATAKTCTGTGGFAYCKVAVTPAAEFEACTSNDGCDSAAGLTCSTSSIFGITAGMESEVCIDVCTTGADCGADQYCEDTGWAEENFCWPKAAAENDPCLSDGACPSGLECWPIVGASLECLDPCGGENIYTTVDCTGGDTCLPSSNFEPQPDSTNPANAQACTIASPTECTDNFVCTSFADGDFCIRPQTFCGSASPITTNFTETGLDGLVNDFANNDTQTLCDVPGYSWFCGEVANGDAVVECAQLNSGFVYQDTQGNAFDCNYSSSDPNGSNLGCTLIGGECVNWQSGPACGFIAAMCVAFCESEDGLVSYTCPGGQTCGVPDVGVGYPIVETSGTPPTEVSCSDVTDCDAVDGFSCVQFANGNYCARDRKVCGTTGVTGT